MTIEATVSLLVEQQEKILNIFNSKITEWDSKLNSDGGILKGSLILSDFGIIDIANGKIGLGTISPIDFITIKSPVIDHDTIFSILSNQKGSSIFRLGYSDEDKQYDHLSVLEFYSGKDKTSLLKDLDGSFNINHDSSNGFFINTKQDVDFKISIKDSTKFKISKETGNILFNTDEDLLDASIQINGSVKIAEHLTLLNSLTFNTTDPIIQQTIDSSYLRLCGGSKWIEGGASILLFGKNEPNNAFSFKLFTAPLGEASLSIDSQKTAKFTGKVTAPYLNLESTNIDNVPTLPQIIFKDSSQPANNRLWQIRTEDKEFIIRTLDDNNNPGYKEIRVVRSPTSNDMTQVIFGDLNDISLDMVSSTINIDNEKVIGRRQSGWKNVTNITNTSKDLQSISGDNSELAKVVRALINDLISHGLIGL